MRVNVAEAAAVTWRSFDVDTEKGADVRRELATAIVPRRLGPARTATDADEP